MTVTEGQTCSGINAQLALGASITGTVTDQNGAPIANISVSRVRTTSGTSGFATTDATGAYTIGGLAAGTYTVQFSDFQGRRYAPEYFDNATNQSAATPVTVTEGQTVPNIDAQLAPGAFDHRHRHRPERPTHRRRQRVREQHHLRAGRVGDHRRHRQLHHRRAGRRHLHRPVLRLPGHGTRPSTSTTPPARAPPPRSR